MVNRLAVILLAIGLSACEASIGDGPDLGDDVDAGAPAPDAAPDGLAPPEIRPDAVVADDGATPIDVPAGGEVVFRVDTMPGQHVGFDLRFTPGPAGVLLHVDRWNGAEVVPLQLTDGGTGIRVLAVLDQDGPRTFWVRVSGDDAIAGATLTITRTPFLEGNVCDDDCAHLLQLPIPNDPLRDGYITDGATFRYQFGRRDLLMFLRHAGRHVIAAQQAPFEVEDLSQWDGLTPGTDRGAPRHASHDRGKDVDLSLYGDDGAAPFRSYCTTVNNGDGRECVAGSVDGYDGLASARMFSSFFATGRVTMCFLDDELIAPSVAGAEQAVADGDIADELLPLYSDGVHLQHWPNHDNHIHVRVSEAAGAMLSAERFVAP